MVRGLPHTLWLMALFVEAFLVTAAHVGAEDFHSPFNLNQSNLELGAAGRATAGLGVFQPEIEPGRYDKGNDVMVRPTGSERGGLVVVQPDAAPQLQQEFVLAGHPGIQNTEFTYLRCQFQGYDGSSGGYVMNCPTGNRFIGGMSGGPMVDARTGEVWGVIRAQGHQQDPDGSWSRQADGRPVFSDRVFVTPIYSGTNGNIVIGQQGTFLSDNCLGPGGNKRYRCQVLPNGFQGSMP